MKEIMADLRMIKTSDDVADHPSRAELESLLHEFMGKVIRLKITTVRTKKTLTRPVLRD